MRDANRQKMYRAEQGVRAALQGGAKSGDAPGDVRFESVLQAKAFLARIREVVGSLEQEPERRIDIVEIAKGRHSWHKRDRPTNGESLIQLRKGWGMTGIVLTHEYTHHLMYKQLPYHLVPDHGGEFCRLLLDVIEQVYTDLGYDDVHDQMRAGFDKQRMIYEPVAQRDAARRQILRIRSDMKADDLVEHYGGLPTTCVTYADDGDFVGTTYRSIYHENVDIDSSYGDVLRFSNPWSPEDVTEISTTQLRYVETPMVRFR